MKAEFAIQGQRFSADIAPDIDAGFNVESVPRPYRVDFPASGGSTKTLAQVISAQKQPLLLLDSRVEELYCTGISVLKEVPTFRIVSREESKALPTVLDIIDFMEKNGATKSSMLLAVGGGVVQDVAAFSCSMYKRGIPWTFVPTTLLAQGDSCIGGKTAINYKNTKNLLGLFSAPCGVVIDTDFLGTLPHSDLLSGVGEIFRLCITGGPQFLELFGQRLPAFLAGDRQITRKLIATSLSVKRAVIEFDEFEIDIRRSMNYGHSFGHALEALVDYRIPHGVGVTIGILVENEISHRRGMLQKAERDDLLQLGAQIIPADCREILAQTSLKGILDLLRRDKKTQGAVLKLATLERVGQMRFIDFALDASGEEELRAATDAVLAKI